jgi:hypothetical protein
METREALGVARRTGPSFHLNLVVMSDVVMPAHLLGFVCKPLTGKDLTVRRLLLKHTGLVTMGEVFSRSRPRPVF